MKKGFTLVELLIVVVVIVTLMAVSFRVVTKGLGSEQRAITVSRLHRLENCLSGYYAAFGSYPPVPLHGSRDYTYMVNDSGIQMIYEDRHWSAGEMSRNWESVRAACRSQPFAFECPFPSSAANDIQQHYPYYSANYVSLGFTDPRWRTADSNWSDVQLFKFGVMSFLLPRLVIMCNGCKNSSDSLFELLDNQKQWLENTDMPINFDTGQPYSSWRDAASDLVGANNRWKLWLQPSQAVCARWMENLKGLVSATPIRENGDLSDARGGSDDWMKFYGVSIYNGASDEPAGGSCDTLRPWDGEGSGHYDNKVHYILSSGNPQSNAGTKYCLRWATVTDLFGPSGSWPTAGTDFYYYSPAPYQTYILWSAGKNTKTFPPWVTEEELATMDAADRKTAQEWIMDDIVHMKN